MRKHPENIKRLHTTHNHQQYLIRKHTYSVASIALGITLFLGINNQTQAAEIQNNNQIHSSKITNGNKEYNHYLNDGVTKANDEEVTAELLSTTSTEIKNTSRNSTVNTNEKLNKVDTYVDSESKHLENKYNTTSKQHILDKNNSLINPSIHSKQETTDKHISSTPQNTSEEIGFKVKQETTDKHISSTPQNTSEEIGFKVKQETTDDKSIMDNYIEKPAKISHSNGNSYIDFKLTNPTWWKQFDLFNDKESLSTTTLSENKKVKVIRAKVPSGINSLIAKVHILIPNINYNMYHTTRIILDKKVPSPPNNSINSTKGKKILEKAKQERLAIDSAFLLEDKIKEIKKILKVTAKENKKAYEHELTIIEEQLKKEQARALNEFEKSKGIQIDLSNAKTHQVTLKHGTKESNSSMDSYIIRPTKIIDYNNRKHLIITLKDKNIWKDIRIEGENEYNYPIIINNETASNEKKIMFPIINNQTLYNAIIKFKIPVDKDFVYNGAYKVRFEVEDLNKLSEVTPSKDEETNINFTNNSVNPTKESNTPKDSQIIEEKTEKSINKNVNALPALTDIFYSSVKADIADTFLSEDGQDVLNKYKQQSDDQEMKKINHQSLKNFTIEVPELELKKYKNAKQDYLSISKPYRNQSTNLAANSNKENKLKKAVNHVSNKKLVTLSNNKHVIKTVQNKEQSKNSELPNTGESKTINTTLFSILLAISGMIFFIKKHVNNNQL